MPITLWGDGRNLWDLIEDEHCLPSYFIPFCTETMKKKMKEQYYKFLEDQGEDFIEYVGFGAEEWQRVQRATARNAGIGRKVRFPLYEKQVKGADIKRIIVDEWKIKLPEAYDSLSHNNCIPCFKSGKGTWKVYWKKYPDQFFKAAEYEKKIEHTVFKDASLEELAKKWANESEEDSLQASFAELPCECWI